MSREVYVFVLPPPPGPLQQRPDNGGFEYRWKAAKPVKRESLITEVKDRRRSSMRSASNHDGSGSSSHVLIAVLFNTLRTDDSDTGWKAVSGDPSKTV